MVEKTFPAEAYALPFFKQEGFVRKRCPRCGEWYWTQNLKRETCGESSSDECGCYTFIGDPATKKSYTLREMREEFLSFFERNGHTRIRPYPVVARWRKDVYLTNASIIDFQPYVTEGISPPPANPLVISQPSIRLVDISNTGPTFGRHLTIFEMGGAHAFNYPNREIYWKDQTVRFHHRFATEALGIKSEEVVYKEGVWVGGGNAGPDVECIVRGIEVGTLVFMQYKVVGEDFVELPIRTVDTGYGIDRFTWISQGVTSAFQAVYGEMLEQIYRLAGITNVDNDFLARVAKYSGLVTVDKNVSRMVTRRRVAELSSIDLQTLESVLVPIENVWAIADHTKTLSFMLSEGVVPSNIQEGYLARLLFRRVYRLLKTLNMESAELYDIVDMQVNYWSKDFPHLKEMQKEIIEMLKAEEEKFQDTLQRGEGLVKRIASQLKATGTVTIPQSTLTELYDSHGLPPEIVKQAAEKEDVQVDVPENFYALVAKRHMQASKPAEEEESQAEKALMKAAEELPATEPLYYADTYMREFDAKILKIIGDEYVVLDQTCFYPEGGGQPADHGWLTSDNAKYEVVDTQKIGKVIVHKLNSTPTFNEGSVIHGVLDWERRYALMKAHTVTHLVNGAARRVLGEHVWQSGTQKSLDTSRLDITHYRRLTQEEVHKIEQLANHAIEANMKVETTWLPRNEAEARYGFRLYQGGAVPGKDIRVVKTGDWDVEACAGTHLRSTLEVGFVKIIYTERVQDGVERLGYAVGLEAVKAVQKQESLLWKVSEVLASPVDKLDKTAEKLVKELKEVNVERRKLIKGLAEKESSVEQAVTAETTVEAKGVLIAKRDFGEVIDVDRMVQTASELIKRNEATIALFYGSDGKTCRLMVMAGDVAVQKGVNAGNVVKEAAPIFGGGGGGRPNFAQGGGTQPSKLQDAVKAAEEAVKKQLNH
ncbi:MAG TPA: alanine--tRNA ligase [Candidatus Limnocylindrales bacterium]|nr:alanine--tRNA ligase [Candidatus Limnocylindrales bacterium]